MKYLGYVAAAVAGFWAGWMCQRESPSRLGRKSVKIRIKKIDGNWSKDLFDRVDVRAGDVILWHIDTDTQAEVLISNFRDSESGAPKDALVDNPCGTIKPKSGILLAQTRGKEVFDVPPYGKKDPFGRYQDFTYTVKIDGQPVDPEIRLREF